MVRVVRLERTVSWSQTRRDTNFAIPGYSLFCHDTTASGKNKVFSVCGHLCGQSRFYAVFNDWGKSHKCRCHKAFRRFALLRPGYRHGTPKASALPTALIPAIQRSIKNLAAHYFYSTEIWWKVKRKLPEMILMMKIMNAAKVNADTTIAKPSSM